MDKKDRSNLGAIELLKKLLARYKEDSAAWLFNYALVLFNEKGDTARSRRALARAVDYNRYVIPYLTGQRRLPQILPKCILGDRSEAIFYVIEYGFAWVKTKGALEWIKTPYLNQDINEENKRSE